jgi:hypothetical protein
VIGCWFKPNFFVHPYTKPKERKVGAHRPKIRHLAHSIEPRTRKERQAEKEAVAAERRAIKKAARRHLKQQLLKELEEAGSR